MISKHLKLYYKIQVCRYVDIKYVKNIVITSHCKQQVYATSPVLVSK